MTSFRDYVWQLFNSFDLAGKPQDSSQSSLITENAIRIETMKRVLFLSNRDILRALDKEDQILVDTQRNSLLMMNYAAYSAGSFCFYMSFKRLFHNPALRFRFQLILNGVAAYLGQYATISVGANMQYKNQQDVVMKYDRWFEKSIKA